MGKLKYLSITRREEITVGYKCNIQCRFCFYGCSPQDKLRSIEDIKKDIILCKRHGIEHIELSGGEPMLHNDIERIIEFCREQNFKTICMITNGTLLNDIGKMKRLQDKGLNQFIFSLHGATSKTHNYLTCADTFDSMLKSISNAVTLNISLRINIVVTKENYNELENITKLALAYKPLMINYLVYSPLGFSKKFAKQMMGRYSDISGEIIKAIKIAKDNTKVRIRYVPFCLMKDYEQYLCNVHQLHYDQYEWDYVLREQIHNSLVYKWVKIFIGLFYIPLERLLKQSLEENFHQAIIKTMCLANSCKSRKCYKCKYYYICDGLWKDYVVLHGDREVNPIAGSKITDPAYFMM